MKASIPSLCLLVIPAALALLSPSAPKPVFADSHVEISHAESPVPESAWPSVPNGWRLTRNGWEHTSTWKAGGPSINQLIADQRQREPAWIRVGFLKLRSIPPLMIAVLQITAIAIICNIAENHRQRVETASAE